MDGPRALLRPVLMAAARLTQNALPVPGMLSNVSTGVPGMPTLKRHVAALEPADSVAWIELPSVPEVDNDNTVAFHTLRLQIPPSTPRRKSQPA